MVLVGSIENFIGYATPWSYERDGWMPSTLEGLAGIARAHNHNRRYQSDSPDLPDSADGVSDLIREVAGIA